MPGFSLIQPFPTAVIVTWPDLPTTLMAFAITSSCRMPTVIIATSASWPQVVSTTKSCASLALAKARVAPNTVVAISRLNSTGSTTMTFCAPANLAPCTALLPTPPAPKITTVSPACTPAACTADPQPVGTPQPTRHRISHGMSWKSSRSGTVAHSDTTAYCENVPSVQKPPMSVSPSWNRHVPSSNMPVPACRPFTHMFDCPVEHGRQAPGRAVPALAAGGDERDGYVIAGLDPGNGRANRVDDASALVPADHGHAHRRVALLDVVVGMAQASRVELDPDLVRLRLVQFEFRDLPWLAG